ncbi:endonuclease V [Jiangella aurantiaca]|uniref:endonuclease V n=1 Tax=Jiangella aurantiaca TaxID=2530373 RepID=UPI00193D8AA1|nr:endonuclease V [Jiangella aurantiaca]
MVAVQQDLAVARPEPWHPGRHHVIGGCYACGPHGLVGRGQAGDPVWAAAAAYSGEQCVSRASVSGVARGPYTPGLLALRVGPSLAAAVTALTVAVDVLIVDATGRDHPRRAGLAMQLGASVGVPTIGVTHRPLTAVGAPPADQRGATSPLTVNGAVVGYWLRTRTGTRPVAVHAGWRVDAETAVQIVLGSARWRTPTPLREARRLARVRRR